MLPLWAGDHQVYLFFSILTGSGFLFLLFLSTMGRGHLFVCAVIGSEEGYRNANGLVHQIMVMISDDSFLGSTGNQGCAAKGIWEEALRGRWCEFVTNGSISAGTLFLSSSRSLMTESYYKCLLFYGVSPRCYSSPRCLCSHGWLVQSCSGSLLVYQPGPEVVNWSWYYSAFCGNLRDS